MLRILAPLVFAASAPALVTGDPPIIVTVRFYGESQCPFCRKFVEEVWSEIWSDKELRSFMDYDFVPWGNAYFSTPMCGSGPYDPDERACFYEHCITAEAPDEDACFGGEPIYQHSTKEGQVDIYETCILKDDGLGPAVDFTYCAEGSIMDDTHMSAEDLLKKCAPDGVDPSKVQHCLETQGRQLEIENAKKTPVHPGVPYVLVDGESLDDPFETKKAVCDKLKEQGVNPKACSSGDILLRQA
jgi:Gamma interferon inducible lysosomal thiol reductase (GILT)